VTKKRLSLAVLALAAAETLFWLYTFYYINHRTNPLGDGLEWMAEVPLTIIVLAGVVPAALLAIAGFWFRIAAMAAAAFACAALIADVVIWIELLGEFAHKTVHQRDQRLSRTSVMGRSVPRAVSVCQRPFSSSHSMTWVVPGTRCSSAAAWAAASAAAWVGKLSENTPLAL
jgi:hypothetical protein